MLYMIGPVTVDVFPFNADAVGVEGTTDYAKKDLLGRLPAREFVGEGDETLTLKGQVLPSKLGGLSSIEALHGMRRQGERTFVMRGDGRVMGWYAVEHISEQHEMLGPNGVGQVVKHEVKLIMVDPPGSDAGAGIIGDLIGLL
jgi:phage protein U